MADLRKAWITFARPAVSTEAQKFLERLSSDLVVPDTARDLAALQDVINMCNLGDKHSKHEYAACVFVVCECVRVYVCVLCVYVCTCLCARAYVPSIKFIPLLLLCAQVACCARLCARTGKYTGTLARIKKKLIVNQKPFTKH